MNFDFLPILYQDKHLVAINKPTGLLVHRSPIDKNETQFALQKLRNQIGCHVFPVHRLDKSTSGVLLFALTTETAKSIGHLFSQGLIKKKYLAIVRGHCLKEGIIDYPLKERRDRQFEKHINPDKPKQEAKTRYKTLATCELPFSVDKYPTSRYSLIEVSPLTGRKHQIRRHLCHINHPIIGDVQYGCGKHNRFFRKLLNCHRLLLTCTEISFTHPHTNEVINIHAPLDCAFQNSCDLFQKDKIQTISDKKQPTL